MWTPPIAVTLEEQKIIARTRKRRKCFVFLRERRHAPSSRFSTRWRRAIARTPEAQRRWTQGYWPWPHCCKPIAPSAIGTQWSSL